MSKPVIPAPVPLAQADSVRQKMYGDLKAVPGAPVPAVKAVEVPTISASDEEKKEFVRAILGKVQYEKLYTIFGRIEVRMAMRSVNDSETMYVQLNKLDKTEDRGCWLRRFQLLSCLREVKDTEAGSFYDVPKNVLDGDWKDLVERFLLRLPAPLYLALMKTADEFEKHTRELVGAANKPGFWPTVGRG